MKKINRKDINGIQLFEGDIIAEGKVGEKIWDEQAIVLTRPLGMVQTYNASPTSLLPPEETDCYNIIQIRKGIIQLAENATDWAKDHIGEISDLHLSRYDGRFYNWDNIEKIGSVYDFKD